MPWPPWAPPQSLASLPASVALLSTKCAEREARDEDMIRTWLIFQDLHLSIRITQAAAPGGSMEPGVSLAVVKVGLSPSPQGCAAQRCEHSNSGGAPNCFCSLLQNQPSSSPPPPQLKPGCCAEKWIWGLQFQFKGNTEIVLQRLFIHLPYPPFTLSYTRILPEPSLSHSLEGVVERKGAISSLIISCFSHLFISCFILICGGVFPLGNCQFSSVQSLSHVLLFATPWTAACQASLSVTNSQSLPKLMSIESVMPSNCVIVTIPWSCHHITPWWRTGLCWGQQIDPDFSFIRLTDILPAWGFHDGSDGKEVACKAGDLGSIPGSERSPGEGNGNPLQCSCLGNSLDRRAWLQSMGLQRIGHDWLTLHFFRFLAVICQVRGARAADARE